MHSRLCTGLSLISNLTLQAAHECNLDFVPAPLWLHLINSPHILSYLSTHFFRSCQWNYSCRTLPSTSLQHGLKGQWVQLPQGQKSPALKYFVGLREQLRISNLSRFTDGGVTALTLHHQHYCAHETPHCHIYWTILLKPHHRSPKRSRDAKQWMWNTATAPHAGSLCHRGSGTGLCWGHKRTKPHLFSPGDDCSCPEEHTGSSVEQGCRSWAVLCVCWTYKVSVRKASSD